MRARTIAILLASALAEAALIVPAVLLVPSPLREFNDGMALGVAWLLIAAIGITRRALAARDADLRAQRVGMGGWLVGMMVLCLGWMWWSARLGAELDRETLLLQFIAALLIWWRGITLGASDLLPEDARLRLQLGLLMFTVVAFASIFDKQGYLLRFIVPFLFGALFALPLSHLQMVSQSEIGRTLKMDRQWWQSIAIAAAAPVVLGVVISSMVTGDVIASGLGLLIAVIMLPFILIAALLAELLANLLRVNGGGGQLGGLLLNLQLLQQQQRNEPPPAASAPLPPIVGYLAVFGVIVGAIVLVILLMDRRRREHGPHYGEDTQSLNPLETPDPMNEAMQSMLNTLNLRRWLAALTIRRIYVRMSHEAGKRGFRRQAAQTPLDYLPQVQLAFPNTSSESRLITDAYIAAHYGEVPDTDAALREIKEAWERMRESGKLKVQH